MQQDFSAYLAAIVESSDDAIISKDLNGVIQSFNAAAERMFGHAAADVIGKPVTILIPHDRMSEEKEILSRLRRGERVDHFETVRITKDGRLIDISLTVSPVRDASGKVVGASKIARDITERKRTAAALAEQQEWFRVTLNSIGDAVIASDRDGRVSFLNHMAEKLTGWSMADAQGREIADVFHIVHEDTRQPVDNPGARALRLGHSVSLANHTILISREGVDWPIADSASPIIDRDGTIIGVVLVFREISEVRRNEERARSLAVERERLLERERSARGEAEKANRVKDDFVAMVSHELRTPLNAILGWTDLLKKKTDPETLVHGIEVIARNTRLQAQLISDLLDVSRIVSGKLRLEFERIDLAHVIREAIEGLESTAAAKGVQLVPRLDPAPTLTIGDPARLQQILWNLVSNAIKFTPKGGTVTVSLESSRGHAEIVVTDTGAGIRPDLLPDLFERFRQGSGSTTRSHGGLGLGLSITRHLAELHGGSVRAWSAGEGKGATFTVELPLNTRTVSDVGTRTDRQETATQADNVSLQHIRVLVVEDDQDTRDLVRRVLESHRAQVHMAASAPEALEMLATAQPDILVSDIGLPDVDGYELIRRLRGRADVFAMIPAVALTAFARFEDRTRALSAGYNAHVAKPVEPTELVVTVGSFANLITARRRE